MLIVISSVPLVALVPLQAPEAEQLVVLAEDQLRLIIDPNRTDEDEDDSETVGLGAGLPLPPPPPPPQEATNRKIKNVDMYLFEKDVKCFK